MLVLEWKERAFIEKVNSRCFCWFPAAILVHQNCTPIWRLHTKLYKGAWHVSANNSETVGHKDLTLAQIFYILVFYNIHFLAFFHWKVSNLFFCCVPVKTIYNLRVNKKNILGEYCLFFKPRTWNCPHLDCINLYRNDFVPKRPVIGKWQETRGKMFFSHFRHRWFTKGTWRYKEIIVTYLYLWRH